MMGEENTQYETEANNEMTEENQEAPSKAPITNQPKLIISDYDLSPSMVEAGKDFNLSFTLYNTNSENAIYNLKVTIDQTLAAAPQTSGQNNANLTSDGSVFTPIGRSNTFYVASLYPWEWTTKYIDMNVLPNANPGSYVVNLTMEYEDYWGKSTKSSHKCIEGDYVIHSKNLVLKDDITYLLIWDVLFVVVQKRRGKCPTLNVFTTE